MDKRKAKLLRRAKAKRKKCAVAVLAAAEAKLRQKDCQKH